MVQICIAEFSLLLLKTTISSFRGYKKIRLNAFKFQRDLASLERVVKITISILLHRKKMLLILLQYYCSRYR